MAGRLTRRCGLAIALVVFFATTADAQFYISGVWSIAWRESGTMGITPAEPTNVQTGTLVVGARLTTHIALEGAFEIQQSQSFNWYYGYIFDQPSFQRLAERDTPLAANLRIAAGCVNRVCLDALMGGGVNIHSATSEVYAVCPYPLFSPPCEPVSPPREASSQYSVEFLVLFGVDVPIRVSRHLAIGPTFRLRVINRTGDLTRYTRRGPQSGSGVVPSLGVAVTWRSK